MFGPLGLLHLSPSCSESSGVPSCFCFSSVGSGGVNSGAGALAFFVPVNSLITCVYYIYIYICWWSGLEGKGEPLALNHKSKCLARCPLVFLVSVFVQKSVSVCRHPSVGLETRGLGVEPPQSLRVAEGQ